jgi:hypothetical protein
MAVNVGNGVCTEMWAVYEPIADVRADVFV